MESVPRLLSINPRRSIKTRFALRFLGALKKINNQISSSSSSSSSITRRGQRVKLAADVSMASVVGPRRAWSRAILLKKLQLVRGTTYNNNNNGSRHAQTGADFLVNNNNNNNNIGTGLVMRRRRRRGGVMRSSNIGERGRSNKYSNNKRENKKLVNRIRSCSTAATCSNHGGGQANELRKLVPGGEELEDVYSLLDETVHYIQCLTTQVKVMRTIANNYCSTTSKNKSSN